MKFSATTTTDPALFEVVAVVVAAKAEEKHNDRRPTDAALITRARDLLRAGILASAIPGRLMSEFGLSPEKAAEITGKAISRHRRGKLDTKPLDEPG